MSDSIKIIEVQHNPSIRFVKLSPNAKAPAPQYAGDARCDLYVSETTTVEPNCFADIPCGIAMLLPRGMWARITGRSSTIRKKKLLVIEGIIDNGYTGPLFCAVWNMSDKPVIIEAGDRVAQLIPHRLNPVDWEEASMLPQTERGSKGFGSSGN